MITLEDYIAQLKEIVKVHPSAKKLMVVAAADTEGNGFSQVHYSPFAGEFDDDGQFTPDKTTYAGGRFKKSTNAICLN
jgi:hypothetical protein